MIRTWRNKQSAYIELWDGEGLISLGGKRKCLWEDHLRSLHLSWEEERARHRKNRKNTIQNWRKIKCLGFEVGKKLVYFHSQFPEPEDGCGWTVSTGEERHGGHLRCREGPDHAGYCRLWQRTWMLFFWM